MKKLLIMLLTFIASTSLLQCNTDDALELALNVAEGTMTPKEARAQLRAQRYARGQMAELNNFLRGRDETGAAQPAPVQPAPTAIAVAAGAAQAVRGLPREIHSVMYSLEKAIKSADVTGFIGHRNFFITNFKRDFTDAERAQLLAVLNTCDIYLVYVEGKPVRVTPFPHSETYHGDFSKSFELQVAQDAAVRKRSALLSIERLLAIH